MSSVEFDTIGTGQVASGGAGVTPSPLRCCTSLVFRSASAALCCSSMDTPREPVRAADVTLRPVFHKYRRRHGRAGVARRRQNPRGSCCMLSTATLSGHPIILRYTPRFCRHRCRSANAPISPNPPTCWDGSTTEGVWRRTPPPPGCRVPSQPRHREMRFQRAAATL